MRRVEVDVVCVMMLANCIFRLQAQLTSLRLPLAKDNANQVLTIVERVSIAAKLVRLRSMVDHLRTEDR